MNQFKKIYIEITNKCNFSCSFCKKPNRPKQSMDVDFFKKVIDEIKPYTNYVYFHVYGEPLLHPDIDSFLDICFDHNIKVNLTTNGSLIQQVKHKIILKDALRQINFSLHSVTDKNLLSDYLKNIFDFIDELNTITNEQVKKYMVFRLWTVDEKNADLTHFILNEIKNHFHLEAIPAQKITAGNGINLTKNIFLQMQEEFVWPDIESPQTYTKTNCYGLKSHVGILSDGTVVPCCLDLNGDIPLGNLHTNSFSSIMENPNTKNINSNLRNKVSASILCKTCNFK